MKVQTSAETNAEQKGAILAMSETATLEQEELCTLWEFPDWMQDEVLAAVVEERPDNAPEYGERGMVAPGNRWKNGRTIEVGFVNDHPDIHNAVVQDALKRFFSVWTQFANLKLKFTGVGGGGQIRISIKGPGMHALLGASALTKRTGPTVSLGRVRAGVDPATYDLGVRHEAGHAVIGFGHEHQHPHRTFKLDRAKTIAHYKRVAGWSAEMTERQVLNTRPPSNVVLHSYDIQSVLHYTIPAEIRSDGGPAIVHGRTLSAKNKEAAAFYYPR
jgi:hypothetical protein